MVQTVAERIRILTHVVRMSCVFLLAFAFGSVPLVAQDRPELPEYILTEFGAPPPIPDGPLEDGLAQAVQSAFYGAIAPVGSVSRTTWGEANALALEALVAAGDPRVVWSISDLMRFVWQRDVYEELAAAGADLLGITFDAQPQDRWARITDHLIAWDIPAYPSYLDTKRAIYTNAVHGWDGLFVEGEIDWRMVSWGGVPIDARAYNTTDSPCACIPAVDNPKVTTAEDASWLKDSDIIFGIEINGDARAYPRRIMEVREMVNDTLGGRDLGIPYCTLCGAAQAYFTDDLPMDVERPILRTTGLLIRSNKVMYDVRTMSLFDTFLGHAVTGPLAEIGVTLAQATVITTDWGTWKTAHPDTTVLSENLALGRDFDLRNTRDANGPIFPIGNVDPRLPVQEDVIGAMTASGVPVAFPRGAAFLALQAGQVVAFENIELVLNAGGLSAVDENGGDVPSHQAFWFAWSQFYPKTELWSG
ncbi:MAG: DUF3179 domain-containing (seleno)protein [Pseudomonadota bacterium]